MIVQLTFFDISLSLFFLIFPFQSVNCDFDTGEGRIGNFKQRE